VHGPAVDNKAFHVPKTTGGKSNQPGSNAVIALGGWQKVTSAGVVLEQAADELYGAVGLHEIGHNGDLWHGGPPATWNPTTRLLSFEPNCKPVHVSVMNYMFQVTGAEKDNDNRTYFDYSRDPAPSASANTLDKNHVSDGPAHPSNVVSHRVVCTLPRSREPLLRSDTATAPRSVRTRIRTWHGSTAPLRRI
jgi:hypothetical protein